LRHSFVSSFQVIFAAGGALVGFVAFKIVKALRKSGHVVPDTYERPELLHQYMCFHFGRAEDVMMHKFGPIEAIDFARNTALECIAAAPVRGRNGEEGGRKKCPLLSSHFFPFFLLFFFFYRPPSCRGRWMSGALWVGLHLSWHVASRKWSASTFRPPSLPAVTT
jgi:hypothetical protein